MADKKAKPYGKVDTLEGETCPVCSKKELVLSEVEDDIPYFGKVFIFGMNCKACGYSKGDVEAAERKKPFKETFEVKTKNDLNVRVVKSSEATVKIPRIGEIAPGASADGYVTNVEGIINRFKTQIEQIRDGTDDDQERKKAKNLLKKIQKVIWGDESIKITIEDPSGNSAFIVEKQ